MTKILNIVGFLLAISFVQVVGGYVAIALVPCIPFSDIFCLIDKMDEG